MVRRVRGCSPEPDEHSSAGRSNCAVHFAVEGRPRNSFAEAARRPSSQICTLSARRTTSTAWPLLPALPVSKPQARLLGSHSYRSLSPIAFVAISMHWRVLLENRSSCGTKPFSGQDW